MAKVDSNMIISDVLNMDRGTAPIFMKHGMHCLGCPSSTGESIEEACSVHGIDTKQLIEELNNYLETKTEEEK
jgi:hybrid cluster-associated redox disulfide protein